MPRLGLLIPAGTVFVLLIPVAAFGADPATDPENVFQNTLIVQRAMEQARYALLQENNAGKAVRILEEQLGRINGNAVYLRLLRDAYRGYVKDLYLSQQPAVAQKYLKRLSILDRDAASDPTLRPPTSIKAPAERGPVQAVGALAEKGSNLVKQILPRPAWFQAAEPKNVTARAKIEDDPFDPAYRIKGTQLISERGRAARLLAQAEAEYAGRRFSTARNFYEQANQADPSVTAACRSRWAYCKLSYVVEQLNEAAPSPAALPKLEHETRVAMEMSPGLKDTGDWLLKQLETRKLKSAVAEVTIQHLGRDAQGWQIAETRYFRIHHQQPRDLVENVARTAEGARSAMSEKWFDSTGGDWNAKCDIFLYASAKEYNRATGENPLTPGHAKIEADRNSGRVIGRQVHLRCDAANMLACVLPHETTHVVLAGQFGPQPLPRWADEGMAVLIEPAERIEEHRRNMVRSQKSSELFSVRELMQLPDWPTARRIPAFYAQSVNLVDYLTRARGPRAFTAFLRDAAQTGYEAALERHYGIHGFNDLQNRWQQQVLADVNHSGGTVARR